MKKHILITLLTASIFLLAGCQKTVPETKYKIVIEDLDNANEKINTLSNEIENLKNELKKKDTTVYKFFDIFLSVDSSYINSIKDSSLSFYPNNSSLIKFSHADLLTDLTSITIESFIRTITEKTENFTKINDEIQIINNIECRILSYYNTQDETIFENRLYIFTYNKNFYSVIYSCKDRIKNINVIEDIIKSISMID